MKYSTDSSLTLTDREYALLRILWEVAKSEKVVYDSEGKQVIASSWVNGQLKIVLAGWASFARHIETKLDDDDIANIFAPTERSPIKRRIPIIIDALGEEGKKIVSLASSKESNNKGKKKTGKQTQQLTINGLHKDIDFDDWVHALSENIFSSNKNPQPQTHGYILSTVPPETSVAFIGRDSDLDRMHRVLSNLLPNQFLSVVGIGGGGKTELCKYYSKRFKSSYPGGVCWVSVRGNGSITSDILNFAISAGYEVNKDGDPETELSRVWSRWKRERTLFIFDDVENPARFKRLPRIPIDERFKLLVNSRHKQIHKQAVDYQIEELTEDNTFELLSRILAGYKVVIRKETSDRIAAFTQSLPLGIELIGGYVRGAIYRGVDLEKVIRGLEDRRKSHEVFSGQGVLTESGFAKDSAYRSVEGTFDLTWRDFSKIEKDAAHSFLLMDNTKTTIRDIEDLSKIKNQVEEKYNQQRSNLLGVTHKLYNVCVVKIDSKGNANWHLLFQDFIKSNMSVQERKTWDKTFIQ